MPQAIQDFLHKYFSLFSGVLGALTTLAFLPVGRSLARPRLTLSFDSARDGYMETSMHPEGEPPVTVTRKYLRVSVTPKGLFGRNLGGSSGAEDCLIYITAIQKVENGNVGKDCLYDGRELSWPPNRAFSPRHIPRGVTMFANVVTMKTEHIGWDFQVPAQYGLHSIRSHPGSLLLTITATAANAKPVSIQIEARIKADRSGFEAKRA
jgi:hypothetical protein